MAPATHERIDPALHAPIAHATVAPLPVPLAALRPVPLASERRLARGDEVEDVAALLIEHADLAAGTPREIAAVAETIAVACLGDNHLWQDLQLASRAALSALLSHWFPRLVRKNRFDMKWKKFLYKQLCEREQIFICKSPSCAACRDHALCFGPES